MSKSGRKRKMGIRTPSGQLSRASAARPRPYGESMRAPNWRDIRAATLLKLADPRMRTPIGLMSFLKRDDGSDLLSEAQISAGMHFQTIVEAYYRETGIPSPNARAQDMNRSQGHPNDVVTEATTRAERDRRMAFQMLGEKVDSLLTDLCIREIVPEWLALQKYVDALEFAAHVFGFTSKKVLQRA